MSTLSKIAVGTLLALGNIAAANAEMLSSPIPTSNTFYIAPTGDDSHQTSTARTPWQTWHRALTALRPGDTLIVQPGIWTDSVCSLTDNNCLAHTDMPNIDCNNPDYFDGEPGAPITIKAAKERQSLLDSKKGSYALRMHQCEYYNVEGLRGKSADFFYEDKDGDGQDDHQAFSVFDVNLSRFVNFKRLLLSYNNRFRNTHLLALVDSDNVLVEESEFYRFHRHGISVTGSSNNVTTKRNFLHARMQPDLPEPGRDSHTEDMGDECITFYATNDNLSQNDIGFNCEGIQATGKNNKILGGIVMDGKFGFAVNSNCRDKGGMQLCTENTENRIAQNNLIEHSVSIDNATGAECKSARGCEFNNMTAVNSEHWAFVMRDSIGTSSGQGTLAGRFNPTLKINQSIAFQSDDFVHTENESGFVILEMDDSDECTGLGDDINPDCEKDKVIVIDNGEDYLWQALDVFAWHFAPTGPNSSNNRSFPELPDEGVHFSNSGDPDFNYGEWKNNVIVNPQMGKCYLDLNEKASPIGALTQAKEVGANALYAYENGVRTKTRLFDEQTNQFIGCGAVIEGVNDGPMSCTTLPSSEYSETFDVQGCGYYAQ